MVRVLIFLLMVCFSISCNSLYYSRSSSVVGKYYVQSSCTFLIDSSTISLNYDNTYKLVVTGYVNSYESEGIWRLNDGAIILNSYEACDFINCYNTETSITRWPSELTMKVVDESGISLIGAKVRNMSTDIVFTANIEGVCKLPEVDMNDSISISYSGFERVQLRANDLLKNEVRIVLEEKNGELPSVKSNKIFVDRRLEIRGDKLFDTHIGCEFVK